MREASVLGAASESERNRRAVSIGDATATAGSRVPPDDFLATLRRRCDEAGALLIVDSIFAGLGLTGEMWPGDDVADVLCVGKALGGGLPLSAALFYREGLEELWQLGPEDVYTHTHTGSPLACAAALVVLERVPRLLTRVLKAGDRFEAEGWHGRGLMRARPGDARPAPPISAIRPTPGTARS